MKAELYLAEVKSALIFSSVVLSFLILEEKDLGDRGYLQARLTLTNGDFLEVAEYFIMTNNICKTVRYRYQWMDQSQKVFRRRWDNVPHFPKLPNFPHHIHIDSEENVYPSECLNILQLLLLLECELTTP
jgi:hypothetical protein